MSITLLPVLQPRLIHKPYIILAALQLLDVALTGWILHHFATASEGNPLVRQLLSTTGLYAGLMIILALKVGVVYTFWVCQTRPKIALTVYSLVVVNNLLALFLWLLPN